jgi:hypothetical protein
MPNPQFSNLPGTIFMILVEYAFVFLLSNYCENCCSIHHQTVSSNASINESDDIGVKTVQNDLGSASSDKLWATFENTYESHSPLLTSVLFCTRLLSLGYVLGISVVAEELITKTDGMFFFTNWNTKLISLYFLLTCICSIRGYIQQQAGIIQPSRGVSGNDDRMSSLNLLYARTVQCLFEVCGGTAILVTVVAFGLLDPSFTFWNVSCHFVTLVTLLVEMMLNNVFVRINHIVLNVTWACVYMAFVWIVVYTEHREWPYFFLQTSSSVCYFHYSGLVIADLFFYFIWWSLSQLKLRVLNIHKEGACGTVRRVEGSRHRRSYSPVPPSDGAADGPVGEGVRGGAPFNI